MTQLLKIGELAKAFDISSDTIRYYETEGLLLPCRRSASGYRLYDQANYAALEFIINAKMIGFTLQEIKYLLHIDTHKSTYSCQTVKAFVDEKRASVQQQLAQLRRMDKLLANLSESCNGGGVSAQHCSILDGLESGV